MRATPNNLGTLIVPWGIAAALFALVGGVVNERTQEFFERHGKMCLAKPFSLEDFRAVFKKFLQPKEPV